MDDHGGSRPARYASDSVSGIAVEAAWVRVKITVCASSGTVSSRPMIAAAAAYAGTPGVTSQFTPACIEPPGLLGQRRVDRGIAGAKSRDIVSALMSRNQMISDLIKIKMLTVDQGRSWRTVSQDLSVDVGAGVDTDGRRLDQPHSSHRQQVRRPWTGPDEMDGHSTSLIELHCTTARAGRQP